MRVRDAGGASSPFGNEALRRKAQLKLVQLPMEEQLEMENPREIFKYYEEIVVQVGGLLPPLRGGAGEGGWCR